MLDKKKKYTYEEIKEIIKEAHKKAIDESQKDWDEMLKKQGKSDYRSSMAHMLQNMMLTSEIEKMLFGKDED